jgi:hypothetical protein
MFIAYADSLFMLCSGMDNGTTESSSKKPSVLFPSGEGKGWASLNIRSHDIKASEESILNAMRSRMVANEAM